MQPIEAVPVLVYHAVHDNPPGWIAPFTVTPRRFAEQLDEVVASGREPISMARLGESLHSRRPLPRKCVVITFDDGFADFLGAAAPALMQRELPATLYVTTGAIQPAGPSPLAKADMLTWKQLRTLAGLPGIELGAHSVTHRELDTLPLPVMRREVEESKKRLEDIVGVSVRSFAYPFGYNSRAVRDAVKDAGLDTGAAVRYAHSSRYDDPYMVSRLMVYADTPRPVFSAWLRGEQAPTAPFRESVKTKGWRAVRRTKARYRGHPVPSGGDSSSR